MYMKNEDAPTYAPRNLTDTISEGEVLAKALEIIENRLRKPGEAMSSPQSVKDYLTIKLAELEHEVFFTLWLDGQHRVIQFGSMFRGTLSQTSVYPREVVKEALRLNAGAVIFAHNHPSGMPEPSRADEMLTKTLQEALALVEVKVLDHIIVGGATTVSFAERGLI
jgi:DNA repair protein RadC